MVKPLRFGVFAQLVISFVLAVVLTFGATFMGILSIQNINKGVEEVVFSRLPALSYAYQLGQQSEGIVATAPTMVRAKNQTERETIAFRTSDQLRSLNETLLIIRGYNVKEDLLSIIDETRNALQENFARLDEVISAELSIREKIKVHHKTLEDLVLDGSPFENIGALEIREIHQLIEFLLLMGMQQDVFLFEEYNKRFEKLISETKTSLREGSPALTVFISKIKNLAYGEEGLIGLHREQSSLNQRIDGLLAVNSRLSNRFVYSVNNLIWEMTQEIEQESSSFQKFVDERTTWLSVIVVIAVLSIAFVATTRVKNTLRRLTQLKDSMNAQATGQQGLIETTGNDEISDMAKALKELVDQLGRRECELRDNEGRFRDLVEATSDWFWEMDETLRFSNVSNRYFELTGFSKEEIIGCTRFELLNKFGAYSATDRDVSHHQDILHQKRAFRDFIFSVKGRNGQTKKLKISGKPLFSSDGVFIGYRGTGTDITRESQAESRLRVANDIMPGGMALWDEENRLVMWNFRFEEYYLPIRDQIVVGASFEHLIERMALYCVQDNPEKFQKERHHYRQNPHGFLVEEHYDGRFLQVSEAATNDGGTVTLTTDITERMHSEIRLDQARLEAETANKAKSRFLAAASHDLRQPLHAMGMYLSRLQERYNKPERDHLQEDRPLLNNISDSLEALGSLMNALLDISKLEAGVMKAEKTDLQLRPLIDRLVQRFRVDAEEKDLKIKMFCPDIAIYSDPVLIERVVSNLVSNAVRYTEEGGILIGVRQRGDQVLIEVYDSGVGIDKKHAKDIFIEFQQLQNPARDRRKGLGLGLAIVERMLALLDHPLELQSVVGQGTCFRIRVPKGVMVHKRPEDEPHHLEEGMNKSPFIVVIDDESDILDATMGLIDGWGYEVIGGHNAHEVMEQLVQNQKVPDLILADYRLEHHQTGAQAIRNLQTFFRTSIPGVIITGDTAPDRIKQAKASGFHLMHKPLKPGKIRQLIRNVQAGRLK